MGEATAMKRVEEPTKVVKYRAVFDQMEEMFNALARRAYEIFDSNGRVFGRDLDNWLQAERELLHPVPVNITETAEAFEVKAEVPGFTEKEIEIGLEPRRLTITGKRATNKEEKKGQLVRTETTSNQILRVVDLPTEIDPEKANATLKNGVLDFTLPKVAKAQSIRIYPKVA